MQGQKQFTDKVVVRYLRLDDVLDLRFLEKKMQESYSHVRRVYQSTVDLALNQLLPH